MSDVAQKQTKAFQTETNQILDLVIHSLYSNKEIFLRELISNASDAADKLRFLAIKQSDLYENDPDLKIWVDFDEKARTITVRDNGIGMDFDEVVAHLGTVAKSGTKDFLRSLTGDEKKDATLIGQFGVGFYASFIVADKVEVKTRKAGLSSEQGVHWVSAGKGTYEIENIKKAERGTEIILHLRESETDLLNDYRLRSILTKYSNHIALPILMKKPVTPKDPASETKEDSAEETVIDVPEEEVVNRATALWTLPKTEIKEAQYNELYKEIGHDFEDPLVWAHNRVEGKLEYITLLFIPKRAPFDLFQANKPRGLKLYVQRVFIMDDAEQFIPHYLRFVRGIIDSNDLPLNVSRELLQSNQAMDSMRAATVKRILGMLENMAKNQPDKYTTFWKEFGQVIKEGPAEDFANKDKIAGLLRFSSTFDDKPEQNTSLADYVARMKPEQKHIYYVAADSFSAAQHSPHLEVFRKKGIEVLLMHDRIDEWLMSHLTKFDDKTFQSVAKGGLDLGDLEDKAEKEAQQAEEKNYEAVLKKMQDVLKEDVKEIRITHRLTDSPACVVADENAMTGQMERLMKAAGQTIPTSKPILELNPKHMMVEKLKAGIDAAHFEDWSRILLDQAILAEGG